MKLCAALLCLFPGMAAACALPPSVILTLPTGHYMAGAAGTVALTGLLLAGPTMCPTSAPAFWPNARSFCPSP
jgi:hypothetical protein